MFKELFEGAVAADIAQATPSNKMQKRKRKGKDDCPCKSDPMGEECQKKRLGEANSKEYQAAENLMYAAEECGDFNILGSYSDLLIMTSNAGFEMKYKGKKFQVTVVQV